MRRTLFLAVLVSACSRVSGPPAVLVSADELAGLERALDAELAANATRSCPRPVLRGAPVPGPADAGLDAVAGVREGPAKACHDAVESRAEAVRKALDNRKEPVPADIVEACQPIARMFRQAASHEDACSPYLAGRKGLPRFLRFLRVAKGLALVVRAEAEAGRVVEAAELLLDGVRVCQDLSRGPGAPMIADMVGVATVRILVDSAGSAVLDRASRLAPEVLDRLVAETGRLVESEPAFSGLLSYERAGMALQTIQPKRKGPGWTPPGGFDEDSGPDAARQEPGANLPDVPREQQWAIAWLGMDRSVRKAELACPDGALPLACLRGLRNLVKDVGDQTRVSTVSRFVQVALSPDPGEAWREQLLAILSSVATPSYPKWVLKHGERAFHLAAFRFRLAVLAFRAREGRCPGKADLESGALGPFLVDPNSGTRMTIVSGGQGLTGIAPSPEWTAEAEDAEARAPIPVTCDPAPAT